MAMKSFMFKSKRRKIFFSPHALERIEERLTATEKDKGYFIIKVCFRMWKELVKEDFRGFYIFYDGIKWIFEIQNQNIIILVTVVRGQGKLQEKRFIAMPLKQNFLNFILRHNENNISPFSPPLVYVEVKNNSGGKNSVNKEINN